MEHVIETEGLTKQWGDLVAVKDLTLTVQSGECYVFLGRNGSGKSTTAWVGFERRDLRSG
jgi:ABC-type multidrug transport system ATPase subunit